MVLTSHVRGAAGNVALMLPVVPHAARPSGFAAPLRPCTPWSEVRYWGREVGGGRTSRQPGQVRKEAAVTSFRAGRLPPSHRSLIIHSPHGAVPHERMTDVPTAATPYRVLARKYRPATFADLIGQEALVRSLTHAIAGGRIAQGYMLPGVR